MGRRGKKKELTAAEITVLRAATWLPKPLALRIEPAFSNSGFYRMLNKGQIVAKRNGASLLVNMDSLRACIARMPGYEPGHHIARRVQKLPADRQPLAHDIKKAPRRRQAATDTQPAAARPPDAA
jgi:hypothetical protein